MPKCCPECSERIEGTPKFCAECGYKFLQESPSNQIKPLEKELNEEFKELLLEKDEEPKINEKRPITKSPEQTKKEPVVKHPSVSLSMYFKEKLDGNEIKKISIISISIAIVLVFITFIAGSISMTQIKNDQMFNIKSGFPFQWLRMYRNSIYDSPITEVSNWINLIFDMAIYFLILFGIYYLVETMLKNRRLMKAEKHLLQMISTKIS